MPPPRNLKRKRFNQPEEILFDFNARQDYLTGFHKRKLDRIKHAQDVAAKKDKESKLEARRQLRAERKAELERYVDSVNELMPKVEDSWQGGSDESEEEWTGIEKEVPMDCEENYSDDDRHTTVVIEDVDVTRDGFRKIGTMNYDEEHDTREEKPSNDALSVENPAEKKRIWSKDAPKKDKQKKKKFRYETKAERKITRSKQRSGGAKAKAKRKGYS